MDEEARQFILMFEKRWAARDRELARTFREFLREWSETDLRRHHEVMAEITSHRKALFSILDRLDSGGGGAPA